MLRVFNMKYSILNIVQLMCQEVHESAVKCHMVRKLELENNSLVLYVRLGQTDSGFYHLVQGILKLHEITSCPNSA